MYGNHQKQNEDIHMLCKVLDSMAAQTLELKKRMLMGKHIPSWADYKIYKAADAIKGALGSTYSMKDHMSHRMPVSIAIQKVAQLKGMTYDPNNALIMQLKQRHGDNWKSVLAKRRGILPKNIMPVQQGGVGIQKSASLKRQLGKTLLAFGVGAKLAAPPAGKPAAYKAFMRRKAQMHLPHKRSLISQRRKKILDSSSIREGVLRPGLK